MSASKVDDVGCKFKWGKRGRGGKCGGQPVQFYESFTYDGIEYFLYDSVYLYTIDDSEPYIGKLLKAWEEHGTKIRRIKVLWFFRPVEIHNWLGNAKVQKNELFLASGEGVGLLGVNSLDRRKWFKEPPWGEQMKKARNQGTIVLLSNLDPSYISSDVEDIISHAFQESCKAKVIQHPIFSTPQCGQAFVIFKTRDVADRVVKRLMRGCLMLPNGRPLVATKNVPPQDNLDKFVGHFAIDRLRVANREEWKRAVFSSHCSQPNTIEYEMALEWKLQRDISDKCWMELYKEQIEELESLRGQLKKK